MNRHLKLLPLLLAAALTVNGCAGDKGKELFETAQFEEKQNNREHAIKLYQELVSKYPDSDLAKRAGIRLMVLKGNPH
jgi:TolA-binding protein